MSGPTSTMADMPSTTAAAAPHCTTAVPGENGHVPVDSCNSYYHYYPSFAANCALAVLFGASFLAHITQAVAWKKKFCWVLLMGVSWELLAFITRTLGTKDQQNLGYASAGQIFFLLAPLWINAFVYMTAARVVLYTITDQSIWRIKAAWLTQIFVWIDVACFIVQAGGGMMMSNTDTDTRPNANTIEVGKKVYMGGCGAQLGFIVIFVAMMVRVYMKMRAIPSVDANMGRAKMLFWTLAAVLVLIMMRIIFRLIEFGPGTDSNNYMLANEAWAIGLDAVPMLFATLLLNAIHPGWVLRGPNSEFPHVSRQEKKQIKAEKKVAKLEKKLAKDRKRGSSVNELQEGNASWSEELEMRVRQPQRLHAYQPIEQQGGVCDL